MAKRKNRGAGKRFSDNQRQKMIEATKRLEMVGDVDFCDLNAAAEAKKPATFSMLAYTGGKIYPKGYRIPVVVDLKSASVYTPEASPVYKEHEPRDVVGHGQIVIDTTAHEIRLENGIVSGKTAAAAEVVESSKDGFPWRSSIGGGQGKRIYYDRGRKVEANGQVFEGPVILATGVVIGEISFVTLGGDRYSTATIAAAHSSEDEMDEEFKIWAASQGFKDVENMAETAVAFLQAQYEQENGDGDGNPAGPTPGTKTQTLPPIDVKAMTGQFRDEARKQYAEAAKHAGELGKISAQYNVTEIEVDKKKVDFVAHALEAGWSIEQARDKARLEQLLANRSNVAIHSHSGEPLEANLLTAGICQSLGMEEKSIGASDEVLQAAHTRWGGRMSLQELFLEAAAEAGHSFRRYNGNEREVLQAAFSTISLPVAMSNTANKTALAAFMAVMTEWQAVADVSSASDFKTMTRHRLTGDLNFEKVGKSGEIQHGKLGEETFENKVDTYAKMLALTRQDIRNDDLGQLNRVPRMLGRGGGLEFNKVFWKVFESMAFAANTQSLIAGAAQPWYLIAPPAGIPLIEAAFLDGKQSPYIESTEADFNTLGVQMRGFFDFGVGQQDIRAGLKVATALNYDNLTEALIFWDTKVDANKNPLVEEPSILLVHPSDYMAAMELMKSTEIQTDAAGTHGTKNLHQGRLTVVKSKYLTTV